MLTSRKNICKKILALTLALCSFLSLIIFSSCSVTEKQVALKIDGVEITDDVTTYFLDIATNELGYDKGTGAVKDRTVELCMKYFKTNTLAYAHSIKLTVEEKVSVSERVNATWSIYGKYYEKIGVRKDTLTKVITADVYRDKLILAYYDKGGVQEIAESRLYASFKSNYITFQAITGYFTTTDLEGNKVRISQNEMETLVLQFQNIKDMVNSGEHDMKGAADYLSQSGIQCSVQTVVLHKDDDTYPQGFFEKVQKTDTRQATVIASNDYIFLVLRGEADINNDFFIGKKVEIIKSIVGDGIDTIIDGAYSFESNVASAGFNDIYSLVKKEKSGNE